MIPVILAGGSGSRLWPLSKKNHPKQFLKLIGNYSLFQETLFRVKDIPGTEEILVVINIAHAEICQKQINEIKIENVKVILEPYSRNTAPAIALAAFIIEKQFGKNKTMIVLPADHFIVGRKEFSKIMTSADSLAQKSLLITFGIIPTSPKTGYGYIQAAAPLKDFGYKVKRFIEKPDKPLAETFLAKKNYYWNSGIFLFRVTTYLEELKRYSASIYRASLKSYLTSVMKKKGLYIDEKSFEKCPNSSIDYAIMEHTDKAVVIPFNLPWSDLGCWTSVADIGDSDEKNNVTRGNVLLKNCERCLLISKSHQFVATIGLKDLIIISTPEAILVADKAHAQEVTEIVEKTVGN